MTLRTRDGWAWAVRTILVNAAVAAAGGCAPKPIADTSAPLTALETVMPETAAAPSLPATRQPASFEELCERPLYTFTEAEVDIYLRRARDLEPDLSKRVVHLGRKNIGQPYEIYLLGEFPFELYDPQPLYCLAKSDCVVFSEHTYAMALAEDWPSFFRILQRIRYKDGRIGVLTRNHFTEADWDRNNAWLFEDITRKLGAGTKWIELHQVCRRARFFKQRYNLDTDIPDEVVVDAYIPTANVPSILAELRDGDFVNIIRGDANSQWAGHTGLIAIAPDGTVDFLHSSKPEVREQPLLEYLGDGSKQLGIKILRLRPDAEELAQAELDSESGT